MSPWYFKRLHNYSDCCSRTGWQDYKNWNVFQKPLGFFFLFPFFFKIYFPPCSQGVHCSLNGYTGKESQIGMGQIGNSRPPLFCCCSKRKRKGIQPPDFHNHDGPPWWCPAHCRECFGKGQLWSPSCGAMEERPSLTQKHWVPEAAPTRRVMTREGSKLYHVR